MATTVQDGALIRLTRCSSRHLERRSPWPFVTGELRPNSESADSSLHFSGFRKYSVLLLPPSFSFSLKKMLIHYSLAVVGCRFFLDSWFCVYPLPHFTSVSVFRRMCARESWHSKAAVGSLCSQGPLSWGLKWSQNSQEFNFETKSGLWHVCAIKWKRMIVYFYLKIKWHWSKKIY